MSGSPTAGSPSRPLPARTAITDDELMVSVRGGSTAAFAVLYGRYHARVYRISRAVCHDDGRADEAVQEAFIGIWAARAAYEDRGNVAAWVLAVARNRAIDVDRRNQPHAAHRARAELLDIVPAAGDMEERTIATDGSTELRGRVALLPDAQRIVLTLAFYGQLTQLEIATHLAVPVGTVKGRMRLGLQRLRGD